MAYLGYAYRGETDLAFEWLERAYLQRDPGLGMMNVSRPFQKLRGDPRWQPFTLPAVHREDGAGA